MLEELFKAKVPNVNFFNQNGQKVYYLYKKTTKRAQQKYVFKPIYYILFSLP